MASGYMTDGVGNRCPVRYTMKNNPGAIDPKITVNTVSCRSESEMCTRIQEHMKKLQSEDRFDQETFEVEVESDKIPDLVIVDLPGLIAAMDSDEQMMKHKQALDDICMAFLTDRKDDSLGRSVWTYKPVLVRPAADPQLDQLSFKEVDALVRAKRPNWQKDTIFIVNKVDLKCKVNSAKDFVGFLTAWNKFGETVFVMLNPKGENMAKMTPPQLKYHFQTVHHKEREKWDIIMQDFSADAGYPVIQEIRSKQCGVSRMQELMRRAMVSVVKDAVPRLRSLFDELHADKRRAVDRLQEQLELCDPHKLRDKVKEFSTSFQTKLRKLYAGGFPLRGFRRTWEQEMDEFQIFLKRNSQASTWAKVYYIPATELIDILKAEERIELAQEAEAVISGPVCISRALSLWSCMVGLMSRPNYTAGDIETMSEGMHGSMQPEPWMVARNLSKNAIEHLRNACVWLGEYLRWRLLSNATFTFHFCIAEELNARQSVQATAKIDSSRQVIQMAGQIEENLKRLYGICLEDYKYVIEEIVDTFTNLSLVDPGDEVDVLDEWMPEKFVNLARSLATFKRIDSREEYEDYMKAKRVVSEVIDETNEDNKENEEITEINEEHNDDNVRRSNADQLKNAFGAISGDRTLQDRQFLDLILPTRPGVWKTTVIETNTKVLQIVDLYWSKVKYSTIEQIQQKMLHRIMSDIRHNTEKVQNALNLGVLRPKIRDLVNKLCAQTHMPKRELEKLIQDKIDDPSSGIRKPVRDMSDAELIQAYDADTETWDQELQLAKQELQEFTKQKEEVMEMIQELTNLGFNASG